MAVKRPYNGYDSLDREEYYGRLVFPQHPSFFNQVFQSLNTSLTVGRAVTFRQLSFGDRPAVAVRELGVPRHVIENQGMSSEILFYKEKINDLRVITQLHFYRDELFCASYTFRHENNESRLAIKRMLFEKYAGPDGVALEGHLSLTDGFGNSINIVDSVFLHILYLWGDEKIQRAVSGYARSIHFAESLKKKKFRDELFGKL